MGKVEEKYIKTKDKKDLQMWIIYPPDFDQSKKYPALLFCEGGPQSSLDQFWSYRWNMQMMAAKGYIVFAPNRRGVSGFGQEWKEEISGDYGGKNIQDYLDATDAMAKEPYVDANQTWSCGSKLWRLFSLLSGRCSWRTDSRHSLPIAVCSISTVSTDQPRNYGFLIRIMEALTGTIHQAINILRILWLITGQLLY